MPELSVIIITKNEAANIRDCLKSVTWANEVVVVDAGSTDETVEICKELGAHVYEHAWPGFGVQKNRALSYATNDWVFSIDADERVSDALKQEILAAVQSEKYNAYLVPRSSSYCGKFIRHGGWSPDYVLRLFRKASAHFTNDIIHEKVVSSGKSGKLTKPIIHYTFRDLEKVLDTVNRYSTAGAAMRHNRGQSSTLLEAAFRGFWAFFRTYILKLGILDGAEGFMLAVSNAEGTYYKYLKLRLLTLKHKREI
jgi:glycosyltransferase involved in cell wall biosynthesis